MKLLKNLAMVSLFALILLGLYSYSVNGTSKSTPVSFHTLQDILDKNDDQKPVSIIVKEDGKLYTTIDNQRYYTELTPNSPLINDLISKHNISVQYITSGGWSSWLVNVIIIGIIVYIIYNLSQGSQNRLPQVKNNAVHTTIPETSFSQIGGLSKETKTEIHQIIHILKNQEDAKTMGIRPAKGVILHGPPGTGKTMLAKAIAHEIGANFYAASGSSFMEMFVGVGAKRIRELFEEARKSAPSVIFIDEIDAIAGERRLSSNDESDRTLNQLLTELDGIQPNEHVFFISATNRLDMLDQAVLRPGRTDYRIFVGLPDYIGRKEILEIHAKNKPLSEEVRSQMDHIAVTTTGYSGAELESLFLNASNHAFSEGRTEIFMDDINYAMDRMILGNQTRSINDEETKKRVAYHEAGHALIGTITKPDSVRKATIIPRGQALGYVAPVMKELELSTRNELIDRIAMILAGGVAEMKMYKEHSIGVSGDVEQAKNIIQQMVEKFGMAEEGTYRIHFSQKEQEKEMNALFQTSLTRCQELIDTHFDVFQTLALTLYEKETLDGEEIRNIVFQREEKVEESSPETEK